MDEKFWTGTGYQVTLMAGGKFRLEMFGGKPVVYELAEFRALVRTLQDAVRYASAEYDHPATRKWEMPPD